MGMSDEGDYYLLDSWAKQCTYEEYFREIFAIAKRWDLHRVGFETSAGQGLGAYHIQYLSGVIGYRLSIVPLKGEVELADGTMSHKKEFRIKDTLSPICEFGRFYTMKKWMDFHDEYASFPKGQYMDLLDATAYIPQMLRNPIAKATRQQMTQVNKQMSRLVGQPYSVGANAQRSAQQLTDQFFNKFGNRQGPGFTPRVN
jgi:hypothetical protein